MKKIEIKSMIVGILSTLSIVALISSMSIKESNFEFVPGSYGIATYNPQTKALIFYGRTFDGDLNGNVRQKFNVAEDGSSLTEIK